MLETRYNAPLRFHYSCCMSLMKPVLGRHFSVGGILGGLLFMTDSLIGDLFVSWAAYWFLA